ncbi:MAG: winged helix-turn-helix transcriptional regulator [Hyphomicrobiaceae bacterium]
MAWPISRRFNELRRLVPGITQRMLTLPLRALEKDGIVSGNVFDQVPPHVVSAFAAQGLTLGLILEVTEAWGEPFKP